MVFTFYVRLIRWCWLIKPLRLVLVPGRCGLFNIELIQLEESPNCFHDLVPSALPVSAHITAGGFVTSVIMLDQYFEPSYESYCSTSTSTTALADQNFYKSDNLSKYHLFMLGNTFLKNY